MRKIYSMIRLFLGIERIKMLEIEDKISDFITKYEKSINHNLDEEQKRAIAHGEGPLFIMAGPGSGKTEVIVARTLKLLLVDGVEPSSIFLATFTEKAARNMKDRISDRLSRLNANVSVDNLHLGTLHSLCDNIMREFRYDEYHDRRLLDEIEQRFFMHKYLRKHINSIPREFWDDFSFLGRFWSREYGPNTWQKIEAMCTLVNRAIEEDVDLKKLSKSKEPSLETLAEFIKKYDEELNSQRYTDFSHLQVQFLSFLNSKVGEVFIKGSTDRNIHPLRYVLVDEYQDTNPIQEMIYFTLARLIGGNISVVGDDDQALYRFRGGTVECLVNFPNRCRDILGIEPKVVQLMTNYRSVSEITDFCDWLINRVPEMKKPNARAQGKQKMISKRGKATGYQAVLKIMGNDKKEAAEKVAQTIKNMLKSKIVSDPAEIAVLFRSTRESEKYAGPLVEELKNLKIPVYNPRSKSFLKTEEIECMLGALIRILDKDLYVAEKLKGRVSDSIYNWCEKFDELCVEYPKLKKYVDAVHKELKTKKPDEYLQVGICDIFYRVLSLEPFSKWQEDPNRTFRLGQLSSILEAYTTIEGIYSLKVSKTNPGYFSFEMLYHAFYPRFIQFLHTKDLDDPENVDYEIVPGYVQVMTVHQAKGLEFPIVFVDSLDSRSDPEEAAYILEEIYVPFSKNPRKLHDIEDRATQDTVRFYYVAFSRAQNALFLFGDKHQFKSFITER